MKAGADLDRELDQLFQSMDAVEGPTLEAGFGTWFSQEKARLDAGVAAAEQPPTPKEVALGEAAASTKPFDMKSTLGTWWAEALRKDPDLKERYKQLGRSYDKQRLFRQQWCSDQHKALSAERRATQKNIELDESIGSYEPISIVLKREGGDQAALQATQAYLRNAMRMYQEGARFRGRPMLLFNDMTERFEVLYIKQQFRSTFLEAWEKVVTNTIGNTAPVTQVTQHAPAASPLLETPVKSAWPEAECATPATPARADAGKDEKGNKGRGEKRGEENDKEMQRKKKAKKETDAQWAEIRKLKDKYAQALTTYHKIRQNIEASPASWAFAVDDTNAAQRALEDLHAVAEKVKFWQDWFISDLTALKAAHCTEAMKSAMHDCKRVHEAVKEFSRNVDCVTRMHRARTSK